jgi:hypothetical protein
MFLSRNNRDRCGFADDAAFIGLNDFDVNPEELARSYVLDDARIFATGEPLFNRVELWFDQLGIPDWFVVNKMPIWSRDGENRCDGLLPELREPGTALGTASEYLEGGKLFAG